MTESPLLTLMDLTVPAKSDSMLFCIFMASSTMSVSPTLTCCPTLTRMSVMVPGSGALTALPATPEVPATGFEGASLLCWRTFVSPSGERGQGLPLPS